MAADLQNLRTFQWITFIAAIAALASAVPFWESPYRPYLIIGAVLFAVAAVILEQRRGQLSFLFLGLRRYYRSFPLENNAAVFRSVEKEYCYLGVGFGSVLSAFRGWYETPDRPVGIRVRLLLIDPEADEVLEFQARHEHNLWGNTLSEKEQGNLMTTVQRNKVSIQGTLATLAGLPEGEHPIEVYLHRERLRNWAHFVDGETIYAGLLQMGQNGLTGPALVLQRNARYWRLFDFYREQWESIFKTARRADLASYRAHAPASHHHA